MLVISIGMGLVFVPADAHRRRGVPKEDTGVASAVLNTMQQVGGALGLATLSTVAVNGQTAYITQHAAQTGGQMTQALYNASFTHGATQAMVVSSAIVLAAALLIYSLLTISHTDLANDSASRPVDATV